MLFISLVLHLSKGKDHVSGFSVLPEITLALIDYAVCLMDTANI